VDRWWDAALSPDHWLDHRRSTWVWIADRFIPYPLQLNLHRLPDLAREACLRGLLAAAADRLGGRPNFHDGILATFGEGIASHFLVPYNAKLWAHPLEQMSSQWIAHRVAVPNVADIVSRTAHGQNSSEGGPNATFRYPRRDGSGAVWKALARMLPPESIRYEDGVVRQDADRRIAHTVKGRKYRYDYLISSMPIDGLTGKTAVTSTIRSSRDGIAKAVLSLREWTTISRSEMPTLKRPASLTPFRKPRH
jgi:protoporphyrinogen oxidase